MELGLSLGDATKPFTFAEKPRHRRVSAKDLGFCMGLSIGSAPVTGEKETGEGEGEGEGEEEEEEHANGEDNQLCRGEEDSRPVSVDGPVQLDLLPHAPVPRIPPSTVQIFHWQPREDGSSEAGSSTRGLDVNRIPSTEAVDGDASPPYDAAISLPTYTGGGDGTGNETGQVDRASFRASDDDENGSSRKKLRLSKEQSAFLEESFKEHNTLNPKQKLAVANQLNLRPRQVEVWFQNRRARTKLRQTEVDCEYLKKCCETLTVENRRLQKELQELRALKSNSSLYMQLPATTLNMCPSCERVATSSPSAAAVAAVSTAGASKACNEPTIKASSGLSFSKPRSYTFGSHQYPAS